MRFAFSLIAAIFCLGYCYGQADSISTTLRLTALKIQSLHDQHIDTILCYHNECGLCFYKRSKDTCAAYEDTQYLFWNKKHRHFACVVDKCGSHKIVPMDGRTWAVIINDYTAIVKLNKSTGFRSGDDIPEDIFELYLPSGHSLVDIDDGYLNSSAMTAEKPEEQTVKMIKEITATINGVMGTYFRKTQ
jgi:hypothetical protein